MVLQEGQKSKRNSSVGRGFGASVGTCSLILAGAVSIIFLAAITAAHPCTAAEDSTSILKAQSEMLSNAAKSYTDFLKDIAIALGAALAFLGLATWVETRAAINRAVEKVRAHAEVSAKQQLDKTLTELFEAHRKKIEKQIEVETKKIEEQVRQLQGDVNDKTAYLASRTMTVDEPSDVKILWVDDHPENNSYEVQVLENCGATIKPVPDTANALRELARADWNLVISDMRRGGDSRAGMDLLLNMRARGKQVPLVIFYASQQARNKFANEAAQNGAVFATRPQELFAETHARIGIPPGF